MNNPNQLRHQRKSLTRVCRSLLRWMGADETQQPADRSCANGYQFDGIELEARVLYSGSPLPAEAFVDAPGEMVSDDVTIWSTDDQPINLIEFAATDHQSFEPVEASAFADFSNPISANPLISELIFVDTDVDQFNAMVVDLHNQYGDSSYVQLILLESGDGIAQITETLANHTDLKAVHIVSHASGSGVELGDIRLNSQNLSQYSGDIASWANAFTEDGDILFYGCDLAGNDSGKELVESISVLTATDVAASEDLTGHADLGGDWDLEYVAGVVDSEVFVSEDVQAEWVHVLAPSAITLPAAPVAYVIGGSAITIDATATLTDPDSPNLDGGNVVVSITATNADDQLSLDTSGNFSIAGPNLRYAGTTIGDVVSNGGNGSDLHFDFNANASVAIVEELLQNVQYDNSSSTPSETIRMVDFVINDGVSNSNVASKTINIIDPDAAIAIDDAYSVNENTTLDSTDDWFDSNWLYRRTLSFDNVAQTENLTDFPVLVTLDASRIDYSQTQDNGQDLRFVDGDGTLLAYEIEEWNELGTSYVWIKLPQIDGGSNTDFIHMYYGNAVAAAGQSVVDVWDGNHQGVWHLDETSGPYDDSTVNDYDLSSFGGVDGNAVGQMAGANNFDGVDDYLSRPDNNTNLHITGDVTLEAWVRIDAYSTGNWAGIVEIGGMGSELGSQNFLYTMSVHADGEVALGHESGAGANHWINTGVILDTNQWYQLTAVRDSSDFEWELFVDGTQAGSYSYTQNATAGGHGDVFVGQDDSNFNGTIDELRISDTARSADWIAAQHASGLDAFIDYGFEQTVAGVLGNDIDFDGDPLTATLVSGPSNAVSFTLNADGSFTYTPTTDFNGVDSFTYTTNDGNSDSNVATATITVFGNTLVVDTASDYDSGDANWGDTSSISALLADKGADNLVSLREAIEATNNTTNGALPDEILFDIVDGSPGQYYYSDDLTSDSVTTANITAVPVGGEAAIFDFDPDHPFSWFSIDISGGSELIITDAVIIDGYSQSGASENTQLVGSDAVMRIELTNSSADTNRGFLIESTGGGSTIAGLTITDFGAAAILVNSGADGNTITGNYIGTDVSGTIGKGNQEGIHLRSGGNTVGGTDPGDRNVISDNNSRGVITFTFGSIESGNIVQNNYIGVDSFGLVGMGNGGSGGIQVFNQDGMQIIDNVISGNTADGIRFLNTDNFGTTIQGNMIGVGVDGTTIIANSGHGIYMSTNDAGDTVTDTLIGGTSPGQGNVIGGNVGDGINIEGFNSGSFTNTTIVGNFIGTNAGLLANLANGRSGIYIGGFANGVTIGGVAAGQANVIANNTLNGVTLDGIGDNHTIRGNRFENNTLLGIDIVGGIETNGVTANDPGDGDLGSNSQQNFPVIDSATVTGLDLTIDGTINSTPSTSNIIIDFYWSNSSDTTNHGEAEFYIGSILVNTNSSGNATISQTFTNASVPAGAFVTATATDPTGSTSEFSLNQVATLSNTAPVLGNNQMTLSEGQTLLLDSSNFNATDAETAAGSLQFNVSSVVGGHFALSTDTATPLLTFTKDQVDSGQIVFVDNGDENAPSYQLEVSDGSLSDGPVNGTVVFTNVNDAPTTTGIPGLTVDEDSTPQTFNLHNAFADVEDSDSALTYTVVGVSNPGLFDSVSINTSDVLGLDFAADQNGMSSITVRAIDTSGVFVDTTFTVVVNPVNDNPFVENAVAPIVVDEDAANEVIDLSGVFNDVDILANGDSLTYFVQSNTNTSLVGASISGNNLTLDFLQDQFGTSSIVVRAQDTFGQSVTTTISITVDPVNDAPVVGPPILAGATEDALNFTVNMIAGSTDIDGGSLDVENLVLTSASGTDVGVTVNGNILEIDPSLYNHLGATESVIIQYSYDIDDGRGGVVPQTAEITIVGVNDGPTVGAAIVDGANEDDSAFNVDLLAGASDPDTTDTLNISGLTLTSASGTDAGVTINGNSLDIDPSAYNYLAVGETEVIQYSYDVIDGNGGSVSQSATITITGANDTPVVSAPVIDGGTQDDPTFVVSLLDNATDPDVSDSLNISNLNRDSGNDGGITVGSPTANDLTVDPSFYSFLATGESAVIQYSFDLIDGNGGSVTQTATITITGSNADPIVSGPVIDGANEDEVALSVDLLDGASDPDTSDILNISSLTLTSASGTDAGVTINGNSLDIDPSAYNYLAVGETEVITYSYDVIDGNGGSVSQTATITITGSNDGPIVSTAVVDEATEDDPSFNVDLLAGTTDPDTSDTLNIANLTLTSASGTDIGVTTSGNNLNIDPSAYNFLAVGEVRIITYSFDIDDGNGGTVAQTATITITGANDDPTVSATISETRSQNDPTFVVDLLTNASDPDTTDSIIISGLTRTSGNDGGITVGSPTANDLAVDPSFYSFLGSGDTETIVYNYTVIDGNGGSENQTATIIITGTNAAPVVSGPVTDGAGEDDPLFNVDLLDGASDPDTSDTLNVSALMRTGGSDVGVTIVGNSLNVDPSAYNYLAVGQSETITYSYNIVDGNGGTIPQTATITITGVNDGPTVGAPVIDGANEDASAFSVDLLNSANDDDLIDSLNISGLSVSGDDRGITVVGNNLNIDPSVYNFLAVSESETITYSYNIIDGNGGSVAQTATITITGVNDDPVEFGPVTDGANEDDSTFTVDLLDGASDPDTSDSINVDGLTRTSGDDTGITIVGNSLDVDPNAYNYLAVGETMTISYSYELIDGNGGSESQIAIITITGANDDPAVSVAITESATEDDAAFSVDLVNGASDDDLSDNLNISGLGISGDDRGITVVGNSLNIDPSLYNDLAAGEFETITYSYNIVDGNGGSVPQTATITINGVNDDPVAGDDSIGAIEDTPRTFDAMINDFDPDTSDTLSISLLVGFGPNNGSVTLNGDNTFTYTPNLNFTGSDSFSYEISDGNGGFDQAVVNINVTDVNDPPSLDNPIGNVVVNEDDPPTLIDLDTVFSDVDDPTLNYTFTNSDPTLVNVTVTGTQLTLGYLPNQFGTASIVVTATDSLGQTVTDTITVIVAPVNDAPTVDNPLASISVNEDASDQLIDLVSVFGDIDDAILGYQVVSNDNAALLDAVIVGNDLQLDFLHNQNGLANITLRATDAAGLTVDHSLTINVASVNDAPVVSDHNYTVEADDSISGNVLIGSMDVENDSLTVSLVNGPSQGTLVLNPDGTFTFVPEPGFFGTVSFQFVANDGLADSSVRTATIVVEPGPVVVVEPIEPVDPDPPEMEVEPDAPSAEPGDVDDGPIEVEELQRARDVAFKASIDSATPFKAEGLTAFRSSLNLYAIVNQDPNFQLNDEIRSSTYASFVNQISPLVFESLDDFGKDMETVIDNLGMAFVGSIVSLSGVSIGVVSWVLRSSALLTSLMANMPAWRLIDPLAALGFADEEKEDSESVQDIIDSGQSGQSEKMDVANPDKSN